MSAIQQVWKRLDASVRARVFIPCAVLFAVVLTVGPVLVVERHGADLEASLTERLQLFAGVAADTLIGSLARDGVREVPAILDAMNEQTGDKLSVSLLDPDGVIRFSSVGTLVGTVPWSQLPSDGPVTAPMGNDLLVSVRPIFNEPRCAECHTSATRIDGWLEVRASRTPVVLAKQELERNLAIASGVSFLALVGVFWWLLGREIIRPLKRLLVDMKRAERGDTTVIADKGRPDELGVVARGFDATLAALNRSTRELELAYSERLVRADRLAVVGEMATGLAHEIKNPLAGLSGALELLAEDLAQAPAQVEVIGEMQHQVQRLADIMDGLLRFARPPRAQMRVMDVNAAVSNALFLVEQQRGGGPLRIERRLDPQLPPILGDQAQVEQVILNLCLNARQAMSKSGGTLTVSTYVREGGVIVQVADSGPGISPEARPHIFTPFFTTRRDGNGIGLAICARIMLEHSGRIEFACPPAGGTVFTVSFPGETLQERAA